LGSLKLPGLTLPKIEKITTEFEAVVPQSGRAHDGSDRVSIPHCRNRRPELVALRDHPGVLASSRNLRGGGSRGSDGNYFTGETTGHRDSEMPGHALVKMAFYLEPVNLKTAVGS